jgi:uncharacterized protein (DUF2237 family)
MPSTELNVFGRPLAPCSLAPRTGFFRDGCCRSDPQDRGLHVVCVVMTADFLTFSQARGNDLSTPMPEYDFPGLKPGDRWCLCALRWLEALQAGMAPDVVLEATHLNALGVVNLDQLQMYAVDANEARDAQGSALGQPRISDIRRDPD